MTEEAYLSNNEVEFEDKLTSFKDTLSKIGQEIDPKNQSYQNDKLAFSAQRVILANLLPLLPEIIRQAAKRPTQGSVYALTNLITQINDLFEQLRSTASLEEQVDYIQEAIISPLLKEIITALFDKAYYAKQELKQKSVSLEEKEFTNTTFASIDSILKGIAPIIDKKQEEAHQKLKAYLLEV